MSHNKNWTQLRAIDFSRIYIAMRLYEYNRSPLAGFSCSVVKSVSWECSFRLSLLIMAGLVKLNCVPVSDFD